MVPFNEDAGGPMPRSEMLPCASWEQSRAQADSDISIGYRGWALAALIAFAVICLTACGGGGSETAPPAASSCKHSASVLLLGDSTMHGWPAVFLQQAMDERYGTGRVSVIDRAVPGSTSQDFLTGADGHDGIAQAAGMDLVVLNHGMNDLSHRLTVEGYERRLQKIQTAIGDRLLLQTMNPILPAGKDGSIFTLVDAQPLYLAAMHRTAERLIDVNAFFRTLPDWQAQLPDKIHPTEEAQRAIVEGAMAPAVEAMLDGQMCGAK